MNPQLLCLIGPTASGKTALAIQLSQTFGWPILSFDSRQFYREMSIGTAAPTADELQQAPHHFIHSHSIHEPLSAGAFAREAEVFMQNHSSSVFILTGGSGLYLQALLYGFHSLPDIPDGLRSSLQRDYQAFGLSWLQEQVQFEDPVYFQQVDIQNPQRLLRALEVIRSSGQPYSAFVEKQSVPRFPFLSLGIHWPREALYERINTRVDHMMQQGLLEEVKALSPHRNLNALQTVGYSELWAYLDGMTTLEEAMELIKRNTRRYAKRQLTWFRHQLPQTHWLPHDNAQPYIELIKRTWQS